MTTTLECDWCNELFDGERCEETNRAECPVCIEECREMRARIRARKKRDEYLARLYEDARRLIALAWRYLRDGRLQAATECVALVNEHRRTIALLRKSPVAAPLARTEPAESGTQVNHQPARSNAA